MGKRKKLCYKQSCPENLGLSTPLKSTFHFKCGNTGKSKFKDTAKDGIFIVTDLIPGL